MIIKKFILITKEIWNGLPKLVKFLVYISPFLFGGAMYFQTNRLIHYSELSSVKPLLEMEGIQSIKVLNFKIRTNAPPIHFSYFFDLPPIISFLNEDTSWVEIEPFLITKQTVLFKNIGRAKANIMSIVTRDTPTYTPILRDFVINPESYKGIVKEEFFEDYFNNEVLVNKAAKFEIEDEIGIGSRDKFRIRHILILYEDDDNLYETYYILKFNYNQPLVGFGKTDDLNRIIHLKVDSARMRRFFIYNSDESKMLTQTYRRKERKEIEKYHDKMIRKKEQGKAK